MTAINLASDGSAADLIVFAVEPILALAPLWITLFCIYMLTSTLTELVTNNAVAIIMTPIVMNLAVALGQDPRLFAILVMIAASASFATPIGYQTNTLVYAAGGYRFLDFFRIGAPLNLIVGTVTVIILYLFYL